MADFGLRKKYKEFRVCLGVQLRGKNKKEKIDKMKQIEEENESLRKAQDKHEDEIIELEFKVKDFEHREEEKY